MKKMFLRMVKIVFFPLIWCHQVIQDAPVIDCSNGFIGYSDWTRCHEAERNTTADRCLVIYHTAPTAKRV